MSTQLQQIKSELTSFKHQIEVDLSKYVIDKQHFLDAKQWYNASDETIIFNQLGELCISSQTKVSRYLSYHERNCSFKLPPNNTILCVGDRSYEIEIKAELIGKIAIEYLVIEYSDKEKLKINSIPSNKKVQFVTDKKTTKIRLAIKINGFGMCKVQGIDLKLVNQKNLEVASAVNYELKTRTISSLKELKMACIFDEFTTTCYEKNVTLIPVGIDNWLELLSENRPDLLMVESAWRGTNGQWDQKIAKYTANDYTEIRQLTNWCKQQNIPTVFWNKEDPIHYDKFIGVAKLFDHVFTTDKNRVSHYKKDLNNESVYVLPFSAQPLLHNPIKIVEERQENISFAGSYYGNRHEDRKRDMDEVLEICADYGLVIYDRNFEKNKNPNSMFQFPEQFKQFTRPSLKYSEIDIAYKGHKIMLNVNSVKYSPTMFSRRVFEGLACGTPIISSYSEGIKNIFDDLVLMAEDNKELISYIKAITTDPMLYDKTSLKGIREVLSHHTYEHRLEKILQLLNIRYEKKCNVVKIVAIANDMNEFEDILNNFNRQKYQHKSLTVFVTYFKGYKNLMNKYNTKNIQVQLCSYLKNYDYISEAFQDEYEYVAHFSPNNFYGKYYLEDLMLATKYTNTEIVGKRSFYEYDHDEIILQQPSLDYVFVDQLAIDICIIQKGIFEKLKPDYYTNGNVTDINLNRFFKQGARLFSTDSYNFVKNGQQSLNEQLCLNYEL